MADLPAVKVSEQPITSWANKVNKKTKENDLLHGKDFIVAKTAGGTHIKIHPKNKPIYDGPQYAREWNYTGSYDAKTIVRVLPNVAYTYTGSNLSASAGLFFAKESIPSLEYQLALVAAGISLTGSDYRIYARSSSKNYVPTYPDTASSCVWEALTVSTTGSSGGGIQRYKITDSGTTGSNCFQAVGWNSGTNNWNAGAEWVSRQYKQHPTILSETMFGTTVNYSYSDVNNRTATVGSASQFEQLYPPNLTDNIIFCGQLTSYDTSAPIPSGTSSGSFPLLVDLTPRVWARKFNQ